MLHKSKLLIQGIHNEFFLLAQWKDTMLYYVLQNGILSSLLRCTGRQWKTENEKKKKKKPNFHFATGKHRVSYFSLLVIFFFNFFWL